MSRKPKCIYCAGPLFTAKEREEMKDLSVALKRTGFSTFLPQEDGLELRVCIDVLTGHGLDRGLAAEILSRAIFALDVYQVIERCDAIVVNLNGRVPDEGAVSEAAIAWCFGKPIVGYKADPRSLLSGQDNPLVAGLYDFAVCTTLEAVVEAMKNAFSQHPSRREHAHKRSQQIRTYLQLGEEICQALQGKDKAEGIKVLADILCERFAAPRNHVASIARQG